MLFCVGRWDGLGVVTLFGLQYYWYQRYGMSQWIDCPAGASIIQETLPDHYDGSEFYPSSAGSQLYSNQYLKTNCFNQLRGEGKENRRWRFLWEIIPKRPDTSGRYWKTSTAQTPWISCRWWRTRRSWQYF